MPRRRLLAAGIAALTLALSPAGARDEQDRADEAVLRDARVGTDGPALVGFFREHSLSPGERDRLAALVRQLGSEEFTRREQASTALAARGPLAAPFLKRVLTDADPEVVRRARACLEEIESGPGPDLPAAAARLLVRRKPPGAVEALLGYVPHADDPTVRDEVCNALAALGLRDGKAEATLVAALDDKDPARRAAAAFVVSRSSDPVQRAAAVPLCRDPEPAVRYRAAVGRLAAGDAGGLEVLVALLGDAPADLAGAAEDVLLRLAGEQAPPAGSAVNGKAGERKAWQAAWESWRREHGARVDPARLHATAPHLGFTLVPEMHGGKVWECDRSGQVRWQIFGLQQPRDARVVANGRVLICEVGARRVTERDFKGHVLWTYPVDDPAYVERLPNGNTFIGTHRRAFEVTPSGKEVFSFQPSPSMFIHGMHRRPHGNLICLSMQGRILEVDRAGKTVRSLQIGRIGGNWCGIEGVGGNRYLVVEYNQGLVLELDAAGKIVWECKVPGASFASRRPDGRTLVCSFTSQRVVDVDRTGKVVGEITVGTSPWRAHGR
jgi:hypothetical protein